MSLRRLAKKYPFIYKMWFYTIRVRTGDKVRLPNKEDHLYFDGYPRSGNTYFGGLISYVFKDIRFTSHLHVIAGIKMALKYDLPVFIIIRKPEDVIISNLYLKVKKENLKANQRLVDKIINGYIDYYSYVKKNKSHINVIDFAVATQKPHDIPKRVSQIINIDCVSEINLPLEAQNFDKRMREKEAKKISATSALPNEKRKVFKNEHMNLVLDSQYLEKAKKLYRVLINDL